MQANREELVERVARALYVQRPFCLASSTTTQGHQLARSFDWDGSPAYYQEDLKQLARAAIAELTQAQPVSEGLTLKGMPVVHPYAVVRYRLENNDWRVTSVEQTELDPEESSEVERLREALIEARAELVRCCGPEAFETVKVLANIDAALTAAGKGSGQ